MNEKGFDRVAVLGAGTMGHALALVHALAGCEVRLQDSDAAALERAPGLIAAALTTLREAGEIAAEAVAPALARIARTGDAAAAVRDVDLVVEAVVEVPEVKRAVFAAVDRHAAPGTLIASNTSHLDVFPVIPPARAALSAIAHWYTPPYIVDLVDLCAGPATAPATVARLKAFYAGIGKRPVVMKKFIPGYVANRIQAAISREVYQLIDDGVVTPREVDLSVIHGLALRIPVLGHLAKADFTGLPLVQRSMANKKDAPPPPPPRGSSPTLDKLLADGHTGVMSGRGFFDWGGRSPEELFRDRDRRLIALKQAMRKMGGPLEGT